MEIHMDFFLNVQCSSKFYERSNGCIHLYCILLFYFVLICLLYIMYIVDEFFIC